MQVVRVFSGTSGGQHTGAPFNSMIMPEFIANELRIRGIPFDEDGPSIVVRAANEAGFDVSVYVHNGEWIVSFGRVWHQHCHSQQDALDSMLIGLSNRCRLTSYFRGKREYRASLEVLKDGQWRGHSMTSLLVLPFLRRRRVVTQNDLVKSPPDEFPDYF